MASGAVREEPVPATVADPPRSQKSCSGVSTVSTLSLTRVVQRGSRRGSPLRPAGLAVLAALLLLSACAVRLGGPQPEEYRVVALLGTSDDDAAAVGERLRGADADIAFLAAPVDSAWFAAVAAAAGLELSGPASAGAVHTGFLAWEAVGDTTLSLPVEGGGALAVQDALYAVDEDRFLDLMAVYVPGAVEPRAAARTLLAYVATDVMTSVGVVLAITAERPGDADRLVELLAPVFVPESRCDSAEPPADAPVRLVYGPTLRIRCASVRALDGAAGGVVADMVVRR